MKQLFKNKFLVVMLIISILLVGTTSFIAALGYTSYVRNAIGIVVTPIQKGANYVFDSIENMFTSKKDVEKIKKENEELKLAMAEQENKLKEAENIIKENEKFKEYLGVKEEHNDFKMTDACVTGRSSASNSTVITIDKGLIHGMTPGMPVIDKYGLVGCIEEVGRNWSKVKTVIDPDTSVGVYVERTGETGITSGEFAASKDGLFVLNYLSADSDIKEGDRIFTSGDGSVFPKGLLVGTVKYTKKDALSREIKAYIEPISQIEGANEVMIITEFTMIYE